MPRVSINQNKYIEADAVAFIRGKTREQGLTDTDIAREIGITQSSYSNRVRSKKMKFDFMDLFKIIKRLELTDEEIVRLMRGKIKLRT